MTEMLGNPFTQPYFSPVFIPTLPTLTLTEAEQAAISRLQMRGWRNRFWMELTDSYYRGLQLITNLGISIPPELADLRTVVGWPRIAVDPYVERLSIDGFRLPNATDSDADLQDVWLLNGMDAEQTLAYTDALAMRQAWILVGSPDEPGDVPKMTVESPLNVSAKWDVRSGRPLELLQSFWMNDRRHAVLMLPGQNITIGEDDNGAWVLVSRDVHNMGFVAAHRMANQPRSNDRDGSSEITPELMSITDAGCRTILNLQVAGEFYSVPQKLVLGASESDFQNPDGTPKSAWDTYLSHVIALERDENGNVPDVKQLQPYDPSVYVKPLELLASQAAGILGAPPQDLGLYTQGNPITAEAYQVSEARRDRRTGRKQPGFGRTMICAMQDAVRFLNKGALPKEYERLACDWADPKLQNVAGTADALQKYMHEGALPPTSDVTLKRAGFSAVERAQIAQDRDKVQEMLREIANAEDTKDIRAADALAKTAEKLGAPAAPTAPASPAA